MMDDPRMPSQAGLCESCVNVQIVRSDRGSVFYLCRLSQSDPRFPRYPPIPVIACVGYQVRLKPDATPEGS
jgi:hypothetical protein